MTDVIALLEKLGRDSTVQQQGVENLLSMFDIPELVKKAILDKDIDKLKAFLAINSSQNCPIQIPAEDAPEDEQSEESDAANS